MAAEPDLVLPIRPDGTRVPLYCVHPISGSAYPYVRLAQMLAADQPVYGLEAPGYDSAGPPVSSVQALADRYAETVLDTHGRGRLCLLGWSFGGVVAHEIAVRLGEIGVPVPVLVLVDSWLPGTDSMPTGPALVEWFLLDLLEAVGASRAEAEGLAGGALKSDDADAVFDAIAESDSVLAELGSPVLRQRYGVFRAHIQALYGHEPSRGYAGRAVCVNSAESPPVCSVWREVIDGLTVRTIPGGHYSIWQPARVATLAASVADCLAEVAVP
jgi:thioesterase domain-containing protein